MPFRRGHGWRLPIGPTSGPQSANSCTFSSMITLGCTCPAQRVTTHASARRFLSLFGAAPLALLWCVQSGLAQSSATGWPLVAWIGSTVKTSLT